VASHPRIVITANDIPRLQSWAAAANPVYQTGLLKAAQDACML
jgi:hypothetical protein